MAWERVTDGMPEYQDVLLFMPGKHDGPIRRGKIMTRSDGRIWIIEGCSTHEKIWDQVYSTPQPTHWRFMPEPPHGI